MVTELLKYVPVEARQDPLVKELASYSCRTRMHVVRLLAPRVDDESHIKEIDFSPAGIRARWGSGYADTCRALETQAWLGDIDLLEGVILHEPMPTRQ